MGKIPEVFWGWKQAKLPKALCCICDWAQREVCHFGSGPQGEIAGTGLWARPDAVAEGAQNHRSSTFMPITFLNKVRPLLFLFYDAVAWIKPFSSAELGCCCWGHTPSRQLVLARTSLGSMDSSGCVLPQGAGPPVLPAVLSPAAVRLQQSMTCYSHVKMLYLPKHKQWDACH